MTAKQPSGEDVRAFYDNFSKDRMLSYRIDGNLRIDRAIRFFTEHIRDNDIVIDVGCGIGIATEAMARAASKGSVLGVDISGQNIWYASKTISLSNCSFRNLDIITESSSIPALLPAAPTIITMCDVIEHIPDPAVGRLLECYTKLGAPELKILLTYPSPEHIEFLRKEHPEELQIIDNAISVEHLAQHARDAGFSISYLRVVDIWRRSDYVHAVLERTKTLQSNLLKPAHSQVSRGRRGIARIAKLITRPFRRRRYIDKVFSGTAN
jgi:2-polyprenyl-3-methyl-5-hydroxy-6-metoxy-1,4-benzoquinol methylase